ncbi:acetyl-CoA carboxylase [Lacticaseibacillus daqingensis]|uniref:acetyl-CoA carboxylase n=1 Tax=Lacticaseibacillus daqingensis TaxID=2486014 RepID=UPI000F77FBE9|nr:acetyl-CoA carboxylase [Lacticaseibacillus daqingensis]
MTITQDIQLINQRIDTHFTRRHNTQYWLTAVYDRYDHCFNFFFWSHQRGFRQRSVPLHSLATTDIDAFAAVIAGIQAHTHLTIAYYGFTKERWPATGALIQKRPRDIETNAGLPF